MILDGGRSELKDSRGDAEARRNFKRPVCLDLPLRTAGRIEERRQDLTQRAEAVRTDATLGRERNLAAYEDIKGWIRDRRP